MTALNIKHDYSGRAQVEQGDTTYLSAPVTLLFWHQFGIVQAGNGASWIPEQMMPIGGRYRFRVGDFDVTVRRSSVRRSGNTEIINLDAERKRRRG